MEKKIKALKEAYQAGNTNKLRIAAPFAATCLGYEGTEWLETINELQADLNKARVENAELRTEALKIWQRRNDEAAVAEIEGCSLTSYRNGANAMRETILKTLEEAFGLSPLGTLFQRIRAIPLPEDRQATYPPPPPTPSICPRSVRGRCLMEAKMEKATKFFVTGERGEWSVHTFDDERGPVRLVAIYGRKTDAVREAKRLTSAFEHGVPRHNLAAQVAALGADSLLPGWKN